MSAPDSPPLHGYRGTATPPARFVRPKSFTVAVSREAGAGGTGVATAVGRRLGWPVFPQEMLDFLARDDAARADVLTDLPAGAVEWADLELGKLVRARGLDPAGDTAAVVRLVFALAARGEAVLVGRAAGFLLPAASTVHVRVVAPAADRVSYLAQWLRLTEAEAAAEIDGRDLRRAAFLATLSDAVMTDPARYDLHINSGRFTPDAAAEVVAAAVRAKQFPADPA